MTDVIKTAVPIGHTFKDGPAPSLTLTAADLGQPHISGAAPTAMLRWRGGVLEQQFNITTLTPNGTWEHDSEWRPVPTMEE